LDLPLIEGLLGSDLDLGGLKKSKGFESALSVLEIAGSPSFLLPSNDINRIMVDREEGITIYTKGQIQTLQVNSVKMGFNDYPEKFARLEKIISYFRNNKIIQGIDWIDIHQMNRVVLNPVITELTSSGHKEI